MTEPQKVPSFQQLDALVADPALALIAERLPVRDPRFGGRPRKHSVFSIYLTHIAIRKILGAGSARAGIGEIAQPQIWGYLARRVRETYPDKPEFWFNDEPIKRSNYLDFRREYIDPPEASALIRAILEDTAVDIAGQLNLCQPTTPGSRTHPELASGLYADGTVIRPISKYRDREPIVDEETGEILGYRRGDPDIRRYTEGGNPREVYGHKVETLLARGPGTHQRVVMSLDYVEEGGELATLRPMVDSVAGRLGGVKFLAYDTAMRGEMIDWLLRQHGIIGVAPVATKSGRRYTDDRIVEREAVIDRVEVTYANGTKVEVDLVAIRGQIGTIEHNAAGERVHRKADLKQARITKDLDQYRGYGHYVDADGGSFTLRLHVDDSDRQRKFNRAENFRLFPPGSPQYEDLYPIRNDAESANRQLKDSLFLRKAGSYGKDRVLADSLAWAIGHNAVTRHVWVTAAETAVAA